MFTLILLFISFALHTFALPGCLLQEEGPQKLYTLTRRDCLRVGQLMMSGDKIQAPMHWSRKEGVGFKVPHHWADDGTCFVMIDMIGPNDEDTFSIAAIGDIVADIITDCLDSGEFEMLGGKDVCGPKRKMLVTMAGKPRGPFDPSMLNGVRANATLTQFYGFKTVGNHRGVNKNPARISASSVALAQTSRSKRRSLAS